ncbi:hypothetical protein BGZ95_001023 [Linnemannia exigua]|uniref:PHD-type domain-containing protein n=1 Tax=Linnemannia exigua TaxID=604196 RepID=A0AAD4HAX8_9FUNG|nr:hypothetical protein BGZ95_001023 [Linnemannia exigua]
MSLHDTINPWANIAPSTQVPAPSTASTTPTTNTEQLSTPAVVYSNSTQPIISFDGIIQPKNVINDVFLSSTMLYDDVELYLNDSSTSSFDSDSDSGFSTPSQHDDDHPSCFSTPMTPMSPFMENDTEDHPLYPAEEEDAQELSSRKESKDTQPINDAANMVIDMKRPMFIPVSICDARDLAAAASLPTPPECNARKHSYDFLRNSDAFLLGGISSTKRRRVDVLSAEFDAPASPPASNAGDDEVAELSDAESSTSYFMARRRSLFQMRNVRHLTPTSPSMPEIVCFAPPTHEEYDYHPELDRSDDEEEEEEEDEEEKIIDGSLEQQASMVEEMELGRHNYLSEDNYSSSSDDETEFSYHSENEMHIDAMSSSDDSDSDVSDIDDDQFPNRRRGTWHCPSRLEDIEKSTVKPAKTIKAEAQVAKKPSQQQQKQAKQSKKQQQEQTKEIDVEVKPVVVPAVAVIAPTLALALASAPVIVAPAVSSVSVKKSQSSSTTTATCENKTPKPQAPTLFQMLTKANIDWCRYCGTTEGVNWRPGPWGKRTLCNKHGCDFKGYGFACKLPRLDLTSYAHETVEQRVRPVLQHFCHGCQSQESTASNKMLRCEGCPKAFHQACHGDSPISDEVAISDKPWFCDESCRENVKKKRVCVELPKKRLPLMSTPKPLANSAAAGSVAETSSSSPGRPRGMRASISGDSSSRSK